MFGIVATGTLLTDYVYAVTLCADRAVTLATSGRQEAFTSALVSRASAMVIQLNVTALLADVWFVFKHCENRMHVLIDYTISTALHMVM